MFILFPLRNLENKNSENADIKVLSSTFLMEIRGKESLNENTSYSIDIVPIGELKGIYTK